MSFEIVPFQLDWLQNDVWKSSFCKGRFKDKPIQSVCWDDRNKRFIVGFSHNNDANKSTLVRMRDLSFRDEVVEAIQEDVEFGHCNDMAYDPEEHKIYVACGNLKIGLVNPDSLLVERYIQLPLGCYAWAIARYPNKYWFIHDGNHSWKFSQDFGVGGIFTNNDVERVAKALSIPPANTISHAGLDAKGYAGYWQGAEIINGKPYIIYTPWTQTAGVYNGCALVPCTEEDDEIYWCDTPYEVEAMCLKNGILHFVFGQYHIGGANWDMNEMRYKIVTGSKKNASIEANVNYKIDFGAYVPEGYEIAAAFVRFKKKNLYYQLPYSDDQGKVIIKVLKIVDNDIIIRSNEAMTTSFKIAAICKRK